jgi:hypothetical protein
MSIEHSPNQRPTLQAAPPTWGELAGQGERALVVRFVLVDRTVTFPVSQVRRWEHTLGEPEYLLILAGTNTVVIEGRDLSPIRFALDVGRLAEVRTNREHVSRPGPRVRQVTMEGPNDG